ncbi:MAG: hypothetical protein K2X87_29500, partial [Gemmataceae bacterium]|nr:hypothetical protein [Gemmataceae bacterium]
AAPEPPAPAPAAEVAPYEEIAPAGQPRRPWFIAAAVLAVVLFFTAALVGAFHLGKDSRADSGSGVGSAR